jgi:hypothetical protein
MWDTIHSRCTEGGSYHFFIIFQRHGFLPSSTDSSLSLSIPLSASSPHSDKFEKALRMPSISNSYQKCSLSTFARFESCCCCWFPTSPSNLLKQSPLPPLPPGKWKQAHRQVQHGPPKHSRPRNSFPKTWPSQNPGKQKKATCSSIPKAQAQKKLRH